MKQFISCAIAFVIYIVSALLETMIFMAAFGGLAFYSRLP